MITTLSLQEAIDKCPSISATQPSQKASKRYKFISTLDILNQALSNDWSIREVKRGRGSFGQHAINLVHKSQVESFNSNLAEGFPQATIINSHDLTKRFCVVLGFFRLICSNGLIAPSGMCSTTRMVHRQSEDKEDVIIKSLDQAFNGFNTILSKVNEMKDRQLSEEESFSLARFANYIRFRYRMTQPKKFDANAILKPRRIVDDKRDLWSTFNVIQENITIGGFGIGKGITQFQDDVRFNQEFWVGAEKALGYKGESLDKELKQLFIKEKRKKH